MIFANLPLTKVITYQFMVKETGYAYSISRFVVYDYLVLFKFQKLQTLIVLQNHPDHPVIDK